MHLINSYEQEEEEMDDDDEHLQTEDQVIS
jgi:hypothetical protein